VKRSTDRILTTHVGSLVRPVPVLKAMRERVMHRPYDQAVFERDVRQAVADVVDEQVKVGIDIPNDGEFWRQGFVNYIHDRLDGIEPRELDPGEDVWANRREYPHFPEFFNQYDNFYRKIWMHPEVDISELPNVPGNYERFKVTGPIGYHGHEAAKKEMDALRSALADKQVTDAFIPAIQPAGRRGDKGILDHYPSVEAYLYAHAEALAVEYKLITDAGFILQIDYPNMQPPLWMLKDANDKAEANRVSMMGIDAVNHALRGIPEEMVRLHYCWGSMNDPHTQDPPLRQIVGLILRVKAQGYSIEGANPRHEHEWQVWKDVKLPDGKILIPGIISHQTNVVEHPELVAWRLKNYASVVGRENVIAGADCGFSQYWDSIRVHPSVQWAKLRSLVEGAALASKDLWKN
jgi:5-methyltetrahydropteroyltriglutamate--homocysteine methyltransferase